MSDLENRIDEPHDHRLARERSPSRVPQEEKPENTRPNQADAAWARLEELRAETIELGISLDLSWPIATLEKKIKAARGK